MIQLKNLTAGYAGTPIIKDVTLEFIPGEIFVLLGPNGCGKSTLLKSALGLIPTMDGEILYNGINIQKMKRKEIAKQAALLSQNRNTPSIQALRMVLHGRFPYISYPRTYKKEDYEIARNAMDMTDTIQYEQYNVNALSGGQRQGVYLAMALSQDTETVFMDEPTTYLDIKRQLHIITMARTLADQGKAVVLILHDLSLALSGADRLAVMHNGSLKCCGTPESIYCSGILSEIFDVNVHRMETPHGMKYYCTEKE
ncbi:MAG: ABC transporter ATP-binding protein [Schaedlerella sp.]|nr:ABC transporter ATP-binding protein [Schaedlerella sp.]